MRPAAPQFVRAAVLAALVCAVTTSNASAQTCLASGRVSALAQPHRQRPHDHAQRLFRFRPLPALIGQFYGSVFAAACNQHDTDWGTFAADLNGWYSQSNTLFRTRMLAICQTRPELGQSCVDAANLFFFAVNTTQEARAIFNQAQYLSSNCSACGSAVPSAPANLTAQVAASQVSFEWTASPSAASYALEVLQPPLGLVPTNSALPSFVAAGVPNGQSPSAGSRRERGRHQRPLEHCRCRRRQRCAMRPARRAWWSVRVGGRRNRLGWLVGRARGDQLHRARRGDAGRFGTVQWQRRRDDLGERGRTAGRLPCLRPRPRGQRVRHEHAVG